MISKQNKIKLAGMIAICILIASICIFIYWRASQNHNNQTYSVSGNPIELDEPNQVAIEQSFETMQESFENVDSNIYSSTFEQNNVDLPLDPRATPEYIEATEKVPIHSWHTGRVNNIRSESIEQLVENIANFDDYILAISSNSSGYIPGDLYSDTDFVISLFRVRRLYEEGQKNPEQVIPILQHAYQQVHNTWLDSKKERRQRTLNSKGEIHSTSLKEPDLFMKNRTSALTMTYLLGELQDHDSLPILLEGYKKHRTWIEEYGEGKRATPVPTPMTLYAIHRLAVSLPENIMDSQTLAARNAYLEWAEKYVPEPQILKVTAWNADYDESDPYLRIADPKGQVLMGQPSILMAKYPFELKDGTYFFDGSSKKEQKKEKEWADLLIPFVEAAIK